MIAKTVLQRNFKGNKKQHCRVSNRPEACVHSDWVEKCAEGLWFAAHLRWQLSPAGPDGQALGNDEG